MARLTNNSNQQPTFRFQGKKAFLTYSQADIDTPSLYAFLQGKGRVVYAIIAKEEHQDGGLHTHALVEFESKLRFRDPRFFDYEGNHPSIETPRNLMAAISYCKKDGNFMEFGTDEHGDDDDLFAIARSSAYEDWVNYCIKKKIAYQYMDVIWRRVTDVNTIMETPQTEAVICDNNLDALRFPEESRKSFVIQGPSGIGKSTWAKREAPKPALWVTHMDDLRAFDGSRHKSIIFDDMSFLHMPREAQIHIVDNDDTRSIHIRYGVARIPAGTKKIFTCNGPIFTEDPAIARRIIKHTFI